MADTILQQADAPPPPSFRSKLRDLLNEFSKEDKSDTPDFILAEFLEGCLQSFDNAVAARHQWHGQRDLIDRTEGKMR